MNAFLTQEQFRNAIQKGLGRAILHLKQNRSEPYLQEVIYACTHCTAWDLQCEEPRDRYLRWAIALTGPHPSLRKAVLNALSTSTEPATTYQVFALAGGYAAQGDQQARRIIYEKFDRNDAEAEFIGADTIIKLDHVEGLLYVARRIGRDVLQKLSDGAVHLSAIIGESSQEQEAREALNQAATSDPAIRAYLEALVGDEGTFRAKVESGDRQGRSFDELRREVEACETGVPFIQWIRWARTATPDDLVQAARAIEREQRPDRLSKYLSIFRRTRKTPYPLAPDRLIELVSSGAPSVSRLALHVLSGVQHPAIRQLFFHLISSRRHLESAFGLLLSNFRPGDEQFVSKWLEEAQARGTTALTAEETHGICRNLLGLFRAIEDVEAVVPLLWTYENTPCAECRASAIEALIKRNAVSEELLTECRFDCCSWTRKQARQALQDRRGNPLLPGP